MLPTIKKKKPSNCKTNNTSTGIYVCDDTIKFFQSIFAQKKLIKTVVPNIHYIL